MLVCSGLYERPPACPRKTARMKPDNLVGLCLSGLVNTGLEEIPTKVLRAQLRKICRAEQRPCRKALQQRLLRTLLDLPQREVDETLALLPVNRGGLLRRLRRKRIYYADAKLGLELRLQAASATGRG